MTSKTTAGVFAFALLLGACSSTNKAAAPAGASVTIKTFKFNPSPLTVKAGETVTWTNSDEILHTVTSGAPGSPTKVFDGSMDGVGKTYRFTFPDAGEYPYFCSRHNGMRGKIIVG